MRIWTAFRKLIFVFCWCVMRTMTIYANVAPIYRPHVTHMQYMQTKNRAILLCVMDLARMGWCHRIKWNVLNVRFGRSKQKRRAPCESISTPLFVDCLPDLYAESACLQPTQSVNVLSCKRNYRSVRVTASTPEIVFTFRIHSVLNMNISQIRWCKSYQFRAQRLGRIYSFFFFSF